MCTRDKIFTIRGITNCTERGYQKTGFFEVDTQRGNRLDDFALGRKDADRERKPSEAQSQRQDHRHTRACIVQPGHDRKAVPRRCGCVPHQYEPHVAQACLKSCMRQSGGIEAKLAGRSAFSPICRDRSCASEPSRTERRGSRPGRSSSSTPIRARRCTPRLSPPSRDFCRGRSPATALLLNDGRVRVEVIAKDEADRIATRVIFGGVIVRQEGLQPSRHDPADSRL